MRVWKLSFPINSLSVLEYFSEHSLYAYYIDNFISIHAYNIHKLQNLFTDPEFYTSNNEIYYVIKKMQNWVNGIWSWHCQNKMVDYRYYWEGKKNIIGG